MPECDTRELTRVRDHVFITDRSTGRDYERLKGEGFGAVLCLDRGAFPFQQEPDALPLTVWLRHVPPGASDAGAFEEAVTALKRLLGHEGAESVGKVVVHCQLGVWRSVAVVAAYLVDTEGIEPETALAEVAALRGSTDDLPAGLRAWVYSRRS